MLYCETLASPPGTSWRVTNNVAVLSDLERLFEADVSFFDGYTGSVAVNLCVCTSVRKRWERPFGIRSNCICTRMDHIENIVDNVIFARTVVPIVGPLVLYYYIGTSMP